MTTTLQDAFGREMRYLRLSVTERCNLRCDYCRPAHTIPQEMDDTVLTFAETVRLAHIFVSLGVQRIRLTGGEPLVRQDIVQLATAIRTNPDLQDLSLSTNAVQLNRLAQPLKDAGIRRVNISLDSLDPAIFSRITRGGHLDKVLAGIDAALAAGFKPVKVNMVVMKDVNHHEIANMTRFAQEKGVVLRFIETMPVGESGESCFDRFLPAEEIIHILENQFGTSLVPFEPEHKGGGPARYFRLGSSRTNIGIISALSQHFCDTCNRMRLTSRGTLVLCLGRTDRQELLPALRQGADDQEMANLIRQAVARKPMRHGFNQPEKPAPTLRMFALGG
ncbi:MAG: GTP 3',8-cyclase MoaA [Magnetococcales bacterium]|nr:GTP 3',8-cyclase MoaA [Magnetococcales bacterium]NGZ26608.1 GTP 3',8-cyclase MoaA [Magnetococcales bacterium]